VALGSSSEAKQSRYTELQAWKNIRHAKQTGRVSEHNSAGDGWTMGGTMVVGQGSAGIFLSYIETTYGDTASVQQVRHCLSNMLDI